MGKAFIAIFTTVLVFIASLPFLLSLNLIKSGAQDCLDGIQNALPDSIQGDNAKIQGVVNSDCDPNQGKMSFGQKIAEWSGKNYSGYLIFAILISLIIAAGIFLYNQSW